MEALVPHVLIVELDANPCKMLDNATHTGKSQGYGRAFVDLFRQLGYDDGELHPDMFEWLFGLPSMRIQAFLDWFLTSIRPQQSIKLQLEKQDYAVYKALLRGRHINQRILSGEELMRAERACQQDIELQNRGEEDSLDAMLTENATLQREIREMERKLSLSNERNDKLGNLVQQRTLRTDRAAHRLHREKDTDQLSEVLTQLSTSHQSRNSTKVASEQLLQRVQTTTRWMSTTATDSRSIISSSLATSTLSIANGSSESSNWKDFVYQHSLAQLQEVEAQNLRSLQAKVPAISSLSGAASSRNGSTAMEDTLMSPEPTRRKQNPPSSPWLHDSEPGDLDMREQDALIYNKCSVELERLRRAFVVGERDSLLAQLRVTRYEGHLKQLTSSRRQLLQQFQLMSRDTIWARKQILQASVDRTKQQLTDILQRSLPEKLEELALLKSTNILVHSYEQKLWRQEHRFLKLSMLLEAFDMQNARLRLVHRILDVERHDLLQLDAAFQHIIATLSKLNEQAGQRISSYSATAGSEAARHTLSQSFLSGYDDVAHRLFEHVEQLVQGSTPGSERGLITEDAAPLRMRTFEELVRLCEAKHAGEQHVAQDLRRVQANWQRLYDSKRSTLNSLRTELFGDTTSSTPMLLPREVEDALRRATESKESTEEALEKALETLRIHKRSLQVDPSKRMQQAQDILRLKRELEQQR